MSEFDRVSPVAIVGIAAIMPQAPDAPTFWSNIKQGRYSVTDVPPERWDPALYFSADHDAPDKTYSKIGGWVREFPWDPIRWKLPVPPKVAAQMDEGQRWAVSAARAALLDAGWPQWKTDSDRVAVILGNAIGGEKHYRSSMRIELPEVLLGLARAPGLAGLPEAQRARIVEETRAAFLARCPEINEDSMPGELSNVMAGRVANLFNLRGPNFTTDAACASGLAALSAAVEGLVDHHYDAVITGGVDRNMSVAGFVKFCKIGALSATGTRPFDAGADGFVMGEGAALFVLKRLEDAERDGDRVYAVILGIGGSSDGKGKGITAPNPVGQRLAVERAWTMAGVDPATVSAIEAHGTSTRVGDATELESLTAIFGAAGAPLHSVALGSVKSNIGHLKAAAGAAGMFKMVRSLHEKVLAPSLNFRDPNPNVDWDRSPFRVNTELREWPAPPCGVRRGGVSAFGFGGTNFHVVLEEHVPGRHQPARRSFASAAVGSASRAAVPAAAASAKLPLRGALVLGGRDDADVVAQLQPVLAEARAGRAPATAAPDPAVGAAAVRVAVDFVDAADLAAKLDKLLKAFAAANPAAFRMLRQQGAFVGRGAAPKVAFLYTGQGSQYVNMLSELRAREPIVAAVFARADAAMSPLLGRSLSSYIFIDGQDPAAVAQLEMQLRQTEITQPALLATDAAMHELLAAYGLRPDMVMGHSLGEYGALIAAGSLGFEAALEAVSARGREMSHLTVQDNGAMAAVSGPLAEIERIVAQTPGYVVVANINSTTQAVIGGATAAVTAAIEAFTAAGMQATRIPVSHAFHTSIVAPAAVPLKATLARLGLRAPRIPMVANVTGEFYATDTSAQAMVEVLGQQVASPVQFVKGLNTLYEAGARVFVEVGPKRALHGFVEDVLGARDDVLALFTNHPKQGDIGAFNQALCGLWAAGLGFESPAMAAQTAAATVPTLPVPMPAPVGPVAAAVPSPAAPVSGRAPAALAAARDASDDRMLQLGRLFAGFLDQALHLHGGAPAAAAAAPAAAAAAGADRSAAEPVVITGAALGLPGVAQVFDDGNIGRILAGEQMITALPDAVRRRMADMHITRLVKKEAGGAEFEAIDDPSEVIKLAGRHAPLDVVAQFAVDTARDEALDITTRLAIGAGYDALRDAGIPLVMRYKTTTLGTQLPDHWGLPDALRDQTGVIFASAFPGYNRFAEELEAYATDRTRREQLLALEGVRARLPAATPALAEIERLITELRATLAAQPYEFDRRFLFRVLAMGHSQFAELIGARGPNTQVNAACASTTQALALAEDWIRAGRCSRVIVVAADDATGDALLPWITSGFLASGAAATDAKVEDAATPFDRRRHGMIVGMGAAALVVESAAAARDRGLRPICELLGAVTTNSAFHGTRLDLEHIGAVMEAVVRQAEARGVPRAELAESTVFVSHETYTPARGGSASAEISALRHVFGAAADRIVITNTKGFTGHAMGAGIEDVVAVKVLETGLVPPVPNYREPDPELGVLNLSRGGAYPVSHALRLAAGFGSQIAMALLRWTPPADGQHRAPAQLGHAYRVVDAGAWQRWLDGLAGHDAARLEVDHRRLRVVDRGAPAAANHASSVPVPYAGRMGVVAPAFTAATATTAATLPAPAATATAGPAILPDTAARTATAAPAALPSAATPVEPAASAVADTVLAQVTGIVAQMTGYPADLLDPDLDLEADLGVDTVKQAEVFAAVRGHYQLERDANLKLRDFPTLRHVAGWVRDRGGLGAAPAADAASATVPAAAPATAEPATASGDDVMARVTAIVAEMTGYPADLLEPDLDLEADLGVDTVKQAEVFAAVRGHYQLERDPNLKLRDFPTLRHVAGWVRERGGPGAAATAPAPAAAAVAMPASVAAVATAAPAASAVPSGDTSADAVMQRVTAIVAEMTGYPADLLEPDLDLEADLGVDTVKQAEVFAAVRGHYQLERDPNLKLRDFPTLRHVAGWVRQRAGLDAATPAPAPAATAAATPASVAALAAVATVAVAAPAASAVPSGATSADEVMQRVTAIVAEMTGYPADLLEPDLDLEADLGVDTVKQAEVFAAVRGHYQLERDPNLKLRDFPTLRHVAGWVRQRIGAGAAAAGRTIVAEASTAAAAMPAPAVVQGELRAVDALPRRLPVPSLRPAAAACLPTGVLLSGARVVVMADEGGVAKALAKQLAKAGATVLGLPAGVAGAELLALLAQWQQDGPIAGVYWLPALDAEGDLADLDAAAWHEALRRRVKSLYVTMRQLYGGSPFLVTATRLGGCHGYDTAGATQPLGGAVVGFAKSYRKERPDALVKAVDLAVAAKAAAVAEQLIEETLRDPGCVEIGRLGAHRFGVAFVETPFPALGDDGQPVPGAGLALDRETVFVVSGAAGSIVSAITADLAVASGGIFHLLDLTPAPDRDDPDLTAFRSDRDGLKTTLAARLKAAGERATPVAIERELARIERLNAALAAVQAVEAAGGTAHYHALDLRDAAAVDAAIGDVRQRHGRIDVLLHAAGLEISRNLPEKEPAEFDLVFDVKADGWFNLMRAARDLPIGATVVFSSVAGRFGNQGQTDYAAANDLLCKITSHLRRSRPQTRALALDWTAWGGIGMATRGSIPKIMAMAGVQMLPPEAGVAWIRRELLSSAWRGEVIVAGELGLMAAELHAGGGADLSAAIAAGTPGPMLGSARLSVHEGLVTTTTLDPARQPFLDHHRIDGVAVLPGVMGMEAFAEAALLLAPGMHVVAVEDIDFLAPLKFYRDEPRTLSVQMVLGPHEDGLLGRARLVAERTLAGQSQAQRTVHYTGSVRLAPKPAAGEKSATPGPADGERMTPQQVYAFYFHGPAYQVVASAWRAGDQAVAALAASLPENHQPPGAPLATAPRLVELCFQAAGLWEAGLEGRLALPAHVDSARVLRDPARAKGALYALARPSAPGCFDCLVVDSAGQVIVRVDGYRSIPLPSPIAAAVAANLHAVFGR
ncbi:MAG: SDR family NAD(P)-dependent oxidoreductase [Betaproteobacteria bacterium]|nr:SDR family NAD(P)-dependent oxidoreductase [Betaproteobacteria bacterium]